jgi:hypothetical protein
MTEEYYNEIMAWLDWAACPSQDAVELRKIMNKHLVKQDAPGEIIER